MDYDMTGPAINANAVTGAKAAIGDSASTIAGTITSTATIIEPTTLSGK